MDVVEALREKLTSIEEGLHTPGLRAVLRHVEIGFQHYTRGRQTHDDSAFTDAIYRANQAFEGSVKEAYRVLAGQDPARRTPHEIENYLEVHKTFTSRILYQFTNYRREWRNPSTHDYTLDFHESEAFLALVSVTAFACLLFDQVTYRLSFLRAEREAAEQTHIAAPEDAEFDLLLLMTVAIREFIRTQSTKYGSEAQVIGALQGFIAGAFPDIDIEVEARVPGARPFDLLVTYRDQRAIIEVKRRFILPRHRDDVAYMEDCMRASRINKAVLLYLPELQEEIEVIDVNNPAGELALILPKRWADSLEV